MSKTPAAPTPDTGPDPSPERIWRADITSLQFTPMGHCGHCVIHRLAFRTLLGFDPTEADCLACFDSQHNTFQQAAHEKITRRALPPSSHFHLNSRDIRRALSDTTQLPADFRP